MHGSIQDIIETLRTFQGIRYKRAIGKAISVFSSTYPSIDGVNPLDYNDDAAYIEQKNGNELLLISTDGIREEYTKIDPWGAGYFGVVVNVKDIVAMGGRPRGLVNVICYREDTTYASILDGIRKGAAKFGVAVLGGHICPESVHENISIAIVGTVEKQNLIKSSSAREGERIIYIADLEGRVLPTWKWGWDSTTMKSADVIRKQYDALFGCFNQRIFNAGKDVSNAGLIGTIGMLCEASKKGGVIDLSSVQHPAEVDLVQWLMMNPGFGYIFTVNKYAIEECQSRLHSAGLTIMDIGYCSDTGRLELLIEGKMYTLWDFNTYSLYGTR